MMGVSYRQLKKLDSALVYYNLSKKLFKEIKSDQDIRRVDNNLATLYAVQKKYDKSIPIKLRNLEYSKSNSNKMSMSIAYFNLSKDFSGLGQLEKSLKYADSSLNVALKEGFKERISRTYLRKSVVYNKMSDYENAYINYKLYKTYSDSIHNIEDVKKIQALGLKYEFEKEKKVLEATSKQEQLRYNFLIFLFY